MNYTFLFRTLIIWLCIPTLAFPLSKEEQMMFDMISNLKESEIQELIGTIDSEVSKMSAKEQEEFWGQVEQEAKRLEPGITDYIQQQEQDAPKEPTAQEIERKKPKKKKKKEAEEEKPKLAQSSIIQAYTMLSDLIASLDRFICITQAIPEFNEELEDWADEGKLKHWQPGLTWSFFKDQIDKLHYKLQLLTTQETQEEYKYIALLVEDVALYNNLQQLESKLATSTALQECSLETETLSLQSEQILQSMISSLYEAVNILHIIGSIDALVAKYTPIGEQLKQEELEMQERARQAESALPRPQPLQTAGQQVEPSGFVTIPEYQRKAPTGQPVEDVLPTSKPGAQPSLLERVKGDTSRPSQDAPQAKDKAPKDKIKTPGKTEDAVKKESVKKDKDTLANKVADDYLKDLSKALDASLATIEDAKLTGIKNQVLGRGAVNMDLAEIYLPEVVRQMKKATNTAKSLSLRTKKFKGEQKKKYKQALLDELKTHTKVLNSVARQIRDIRSSEAHVPDEKAYAYLGGKRKERVPALAQRLPNPANLYALENSIRELLLIK